MADRETRVRSRELGEGLREVLEHAGLTGKDVARKLGWSASDVSRMLNGKRGVRETDVATFLGACSVRGREYERLMALCREANKPGWWQQYGARLPTHLRTYIDHEDKAVAIDDFQTNFLPGSLQTGDYARAVISSFATIPDTEVDERVAAQLARSNIFSRSWPARLTCFLHEFALRLDVRPTASLVADVGSAVHLAEGDPSVGRRSCEDYRLVHADGICADQAGCITGKRNPRRIP